MNHIISIGTMEEPSINAIEYRFGNTAEPPTVAILERDYLTPHQQSVAYRHLAEYSAWHVLKTFNPKKFRAEDFLCLVSGRRFQEMTHIRFVDLPPIMRSLTESIGEQKAVGMIRAFPERMPHEKDGWSFYHHGHFNVENTHRFAYATRLRHDFGNYPPLWRNYFVMRYDVFIQFMTWIERRLFFHFFNDNWEPNQHLIDRITPSETAYNPYRIFGMIIEFFHHRFMYEHGMPIKAIDFTGSIFQYDFINENLDWKVKPCT